MKRLVPYFIGALVGALLLAAFTLGQASATTGCFPDTNGHWAETFICWLKDRAITSGYPDGTYRPENYITRAEMAVMLQKQAQIPPESGDIVINIGPEAWRVNGSATAPYITYYTNTVYLTTSVAGTYGYQAGVSAPSVLYGRRLSLTGAILCYSASANATLSEVWVRAFEPVPGNEGAAQAYASVIDFTARTDATCRTYAITTPLSALPGDYFNIYIMVTFAGAGDIFAVSSTSFIFSPTAFTWPLGPEPLRPPLPEPGPGTDAGG